MRDQTRDLTPQPPDRTAGQHHRRAGMTQGDGEPPGDRFRQQVDRFHTDDRGSGEHGVQPRQPGLLADGGQFARVQHGHWSPAGDLPQRGGTPGPRFAVDQHGRRSDIRADPAPRDRFHGLERDDSADAGQPEGVLPDRHDRP